MTSVDSSNLSGSPINMCLGLKKMYPSISMYLGQEIGSILINAIWQLQIAAEPGSTKIKIAFFYLDKDISSSPCQGKFYHFIFEGMKFLFYDGKHKGFNSL